MRYTVVLERGGWRVCRQRPALPGCVAKAIRVPKPCNIQEAIALYVEDCRDAGDPVPTEAGKNS